MKAPSRLVNSFLPEPMFLVYKISHRKSGKAYIGMTSRGIVKRLHEHKIAAKRGDESPFYRALRKYGEKAFDVVILAICTNKEDLLQTEISLMKTHRTYVHDGGYNIAIEDYSMPGWKHSDETRAKMSIAAKRRMASPSAREMISKRFKGVSKPPWTEERKQKFRETIAQNRAKRA